MKIHRSGNKCDFFFWGNKHDVTSDRRVSSDEVEKGFNQVLKVGSETGTL